LVELLGLDIWVPDLIGNKLGIIKYISYICITKHIVEE
jgi:hypothetical protein